MRQATRRWLGLAARLLGMVLLVGAFVGWVDWSRAVQLLSDLHAPALGAVAVFYALGQALNGLGWRRLALRGGIDVSVGDMLRHDLASVFWSTVLPGSIAGELVKGARLARRGVQAEASAVAILTARLVGGGASALLALVLSLMAQVPEPALTVLRVSSLGVLAVALGGLLALRRAPGLLRRVAPRLLARVEASPAPTAGDLGYCLVASTGAHLCFAALHAGYFHAVRAPIGMPDAALMTTASTVAQALPVTVGGLGVRELTISGLGQLLVSQDHAAAASLLATAAFAVPVALGGLLELVAPPRAPERR